MAYATLFISSFWGLYFMAPGPVKALYSLSVWVCVAFFPFYFIWVLICFVRGLFVAENYWEVNL